MNKCGTYGLLIGFIAFLFTFVPVTSAEQSFTDVDRSKSHYEGITVLANKNMISGYTLGNGTKEYRPNVPLTRTHTAVIFTSALNLSIPNNTSEVLSNFADIHSDHLYAQQIAATFQADIFNGYEGRFNEGPLTREQMATVLVSAFDLKDNGKNTNIYLGNVSASHKENVKILAQYGITTQLDNFRPGENTTRGQFATFLYRTMQAVGKIPINPEMDVHFIDVGQGDSILIQTPHHKNILIDGGRKSAGDDVVNYLKANGVTTIDLMIATHPDADHIGGLIDVLKQFHVKRVLDSGKEHTTDTYFEYLTLIDEKNIPLAAATVGNEIHIDNKLQVKVLNGWNASSDLNESSIVLMISYDMVDFLLTGDASTKNEAQMISNFDVDAEVLKTGHHGSYTSTSQAFVHEVSPEIAVLSYGENSYGHPYTDVMKRLLQANAKLYSTKESGDIVVTTNGITYDVSAKAWDGGLKTSDPKPAPKSEPQAPFPVNINTANKEALMTLPGIGDTIAGYIIDYRNRNGSFTSIDGLDHVEQIGPATINNIRPYITL